MKIVVGPLNPEVIKKRTIQLGQSSSSFTAEEVSSLLLPASVVREYLIVLAVPGTIKTVNIVNDSFSYGGIWTISMILTFVFADLKLD